MKKILAFAVLCLPLLGAAPAKPHSVPKSSQALAAILADFDALQLDHEPAVRIQRGLEVTKLPDASYAGAQKDAEAFRSFRKRLARIDPKGLTHEEWLSREILDWQLATYASGAEHFWSFFQITPYSSPFRSFQQVFTTVNFKAEKDRRRYLDLLRQYARAMGQLRTNLETQRAQGILLPKAEIDAVVGLVRSFARKPEESPFAVSSERLEKFYPEGAASFQAEVRKLIETEINPSLEALAAVPDAKAYRDAAPEQVGLGHYPGGQKAYGLRGAAPHHARRPHPRDDPPAGAPGGRPPQRAGWRRCGSRSVSRGISRRSAGSSRPIRASSSRRPSRSPSG